MIGVIRMEWLSQNWVLLICPLMMLFCMKGMFGGHKHHNHDSQSSKAMEGKITHLELENEKLKKEIDALSAMIKKES